MEIAKQIQNNPQLTPEERRAEADARRRAHGFGPRWKKGESGNPAGRPRRDLTLTTLLKDEIEKICPLDKEGRTWRQLLVIGTMRLALKGNSIALKEIWERLDGRVRVQLDLNATVRNIEQELSGLFIEARAETDPGEPEK